MPTVRAIACAMALAALSPPASMSAQESASVRTLTLAAGRPLDIRVDERVTIKHVGQQVTGILVQPLYAYDRVVVPAGTRALGHVAALDGPSKATRVRAILSGDLTPPRRVVLTFDTLMLDSGETVAIESAVKSEIPHATRSTAPPQPDETSKTTIGGTARREAVARAKTAIADAKQRGHDLLDQFHEPGKGARLKDALIQRLPYHPQVISAGTGYHAELLAPLTFGAVTPAELAAADRRPEPSSMLNARLLTGLDSSKTPRGTIVHAVVTEPVFSSDQQLLVPEGTILDGEVTFAKRARWLHRNGQLRFLFETIHRDGVDPAPLLASLQAVETSDDDHVRIDEEGGATLASPKTRFIAPGLAVLALRGNLDSHEHLDPDGDGHMIGSAHPGALGAGGFFGLGLLGAGLSQVWRPLGIALSVVGAGRTLYTNVVGRGREVQFAADTPMQLQLAPGPTPAP